MVTGQSPEGPGSDWELKKKERECEGTPGRWTSWTLILGYWLLELVMKVNFVGRVEVSR